MTNQINTATHFGSDVSALSLGGRSAQPATTSEGLSFADVVDVINPLHHLPVVGSIYRSITEDTINPIMKLAGGALFGGPLGVLFSAVSLAFNGESKEQDIAPGGVDAATVANTYPFAETAADGNAQIASAFPASQPVNNHAPSQRYGDGILNPAWQPAQFRPDIETLAGAVPDTVITYADGMPNPAARNNTSVNELLAMRNSEADTKLIQADRAWVNETYQQREIITLDSAEETKPLIDIVIGNPADAS